MTSPQHDDPYGDQGTSGHSYRLRDSLSIVAVGLAAILLPAVVLFSAAYIFTLSVLPTRFEPPAFWRSQATLYTLVLGIVVPIALFVGYLRRKGSFPRSFAVWNVVVAAFASFDQFMWSPQSMNWLVTASILAVWCGFSIPFLLRTGVIRTMFIN